MLRFQVTVTAHNDHGAGTSGLDDGMVEEGAASSVGIIIGVIVAIVIVIAAAGAGTAANTKLARF